MTKVVTFGAFVEIMPGVEGLVHISELAQHHVENPREIVSQADVVNVKIIEVDAERRRLSLSLKRVEEADEVQPRADGEPLETPPAAARSLGRRLPGGWRGCRGATGDEATDEALAETPVAESEPETPSRGARSRAGVVPRRRAPSRAEASRSPSRSPSRVRQAEPEVPSEVTDASIEADAVAPEEQGPGDSEGDPRPLPTRLSKKQS